MSPVQRNKFFPKMSYGASRDWINITAGQQSIETWLSGSISLRGSVDRASVLSMALRYELQGELLAVQPDDRLFVWNASALIAGELTKAGFLARAGKLCAVEMTASVTLERLPEDVFADYLQATSAKMAGWPMRSAEQRATVAQK